MAAARGGCLEIVKFCIEKCVPLNKKGLSSFHFFMDCVELKQAWQITVVARRFIMLLIMDTGRLANTSPSLVQTSNSLVRSSIYRLVGLCVEIVPSDHADQDERTLLMMVTKTGNLKVIKLLVKKSVPLNVAGLLLYLFP